MDVVPFGMRNPTQRKHQQSSVIVFIHNSVDWTSKKSTLLSLSETLMKYEVKLYVGGKVFTESVNAVNNQDAKATALARNPTAKVVGVNVSFK